MMRNIFEKQMSNRGDKISYRAILFAQHFAQHLVFCSYLYKAKAPNSCLESGALGYHARRDSNPRPAD